MSSMYEIGIRPRTTGEILDDASRLYQADAPRLLASTCLFLVPAAVCLLVLVGAPQPESIWLKPAWPALTAVLFALTGLASALCQDLYLRRSQGNPISTLQSLAALGAGGLGHVSLRALLLVPYVIVALIAVSLAAFATDSPSRGSSSAPIFSAAAALAAARLVMGPPLTSVHPLLTAAPQSPFATLLESFRDGLRQPGKATVLVFVQVMLFMMAVLNIHLIVQLGLYVVSYLIGVETAFLSHVLSLGNPVYSLGLLLVVWILLTPLSEAVQFLFHADARARHEGLDLWFRVEQAFPLRPKTMIVVGSVIALFAFVVHPATGAEARGDIVKKVRGEVQQLRESEEYPGSAVVAARLQRMARELDPGGSPTHGEFRWFYRALDGFDKLPQRQAQQTLAELERNLALVEQNLARKEVETPRLSRDQLKAMLPPSDEGDTLPRPKDDTASDDKRVKKDDEVETVEGPRGKRGKSIVGMRGWSGLGQLGWIVLGGLLLLVIVGAAILLWRYRDRSGKDSRIPLDRTARLPAQDRMDELLRRDPAALWRQADTLAQQGNHLQALRCLYAALLGLLHRAGMIKIESPRTNGDYVRQLRRSCPERSEVPESFAHLTNRFELRWYGDRSCLPEEYNDCRREAETIRNAAV